MTTRINQNAKRLAALLTQEEIDALVHEAEQRKIQEEQERVEAERKRYDEEQKQAVEEIARLLQNAQKCLRTAGEIAAQRGIPFTFVTPKGSNEYHNGTWMSSACYVGDGWYHKYRDYMEVDGHKIDEEEGLLPTWTASTWDER
jgi:cystathionine beta-lyase/cystathionine gamma-synthase